ncbi:MAG: prolipoprotein diacylglyceryl transferase [Cytophagales bacterium]|nr:prolipoprotein diacylglyceryl transferase [Cytophagales bacterium]
MNYFSTFFLFITWNPNPELIRIGDFAIRWYGLFWALGFLIGQYLMTWFYKIEKRDMKDLDSLLVYMLTSTVVGARLGHCLFYEPMDYLTNPIEILYVWQGGLASHGATVGILLGVYLYAYKKYETDMFFYKYILFPFRIIGLAGNAPENEGKKYKWFYLLDRLVITIALGGGFIRMGNLMNSEIIGKATDVPWAFIFTSVDYVPRHPSQLYEALSCFVLFAIILTYYLINKEKTPNGLIFSFFCVFLFTLRFAYEFTKENQVDFESQLPFNMGQLLSIPMIFIGIWVLYRSLTKPLDI